MCFSDPSQKNPQKKPQKAARPVEAYRIDRIEDRNATNVHHIRTRASVEGHMSTAPYPTDKSRAKNNRRYPKKFNNTERLFTAGSYYEYPTKKYPYAGQNAKGHAYETDPSGSRMFVPPGYTRTITDRNKNIQGVAYHPQWSPYQHVRARELHGKR